MLKNKKFFVLLLVSLALIFAYFLNKLLLTPREIILTPPISALNLDSILASSEAKLTPLQTEQTDDSMKVLAQEIFQEAIKKQPDSLNLPNIKSASQEIAEELLREDRLDLISWLDDSEIKISGNNSKEAKIKYIETLQQISEKHFALLNVNISKALVLLFEGDNPYFVNRLVRGYQGSVNDYLNLAAPSDWKNLHKNIIINFKNAKEIFKAIADYANNPMKADVGLSMLEELARNDERNQNLLKQKIKEIGL